MTHAPVVPRVLSIAGTDPTGGAGAQADLKSILAADGFGLSVITAVLAQNTQGVQSIHPVPLDFLQAQLDSVFSDVTVDAVKIGMLGDAETVGVVRNFLSQLEDKYGQRPLIVFDPVMIATAGGRLLREDAEDAVREFARNVDVVTPNIPELAILTETDVAKDLASAEKIAQQWSAEAGTAVVVKAGHLTGGDAGNLWVTGNGTQARVSSPRVDTKNTHGTGCSLSSALATRLVRSEPAEALEWATRWLHGAIEHADGLQVGRGHGPVDHGWLARERGAQQL